MGGSALPSTVSADPYDAIIAEWVAEGQAIREAAQPRIEPLFRPAEAKVGRFLGREPPAREWVVSDVLPLGVAGVIAGMGGTGKSYLAMQLSVCVAAGLPCMGWCVPSPGAVLYLAAEDDDDELHRRAWRLIEHMRPTPATREALAERLYVVSRVAQDNLLTATADAEVRRTRVLDRLIAATVQIPDLRLVILDPLSRFRGGRANHEEDATRYVEAVEAIREATGATVLSLAHVSQSGIREGGGQEIVRGSTALVDGVRWVATLQPLRAEHARDYGVPEDEASRYLRFEIPKSNYTAPVPGIWLRREAGGVLVRCELYDQRETRQRQVAEARYVDVLDRIVSMLRSAGPMTERQLRIQYAGTSGPLGVGERQVRAVVARAIEEGALVASPGPRGAVILHAPEVEP